MIENKNQFYISIQPISFWKRIWKASIIPIIIVLIFLVLLFLMWEFEFLIILILVIAVLSRKVLLQERDSLMEIRICEKQLLIKGFIYNKPYYKKIPLDNLTVDLKCIEERSPSFYKLMFFDKGNEIFILHPNKEITKDSLFDILLNVRNAQGNELSLWEKSVFESTRS